MLRLSMVVPIVDAGKDYCVLHEGSVWRVSAPFARSVKKPEQRVGIQRAQTDADWIIRQSADTMTDVRAPALLKLRVGNFYFRATPTAELATIAVGRLSSDAMQRKSGRAHDRDRDPSYPGSDCLAPLDLLPLVRCDGRRARSYLDRQELARRPQHSGGSPDQTVGPLHRDRQPGVAAVGEGAMGSRREPDRAGPRWHRA